MAAGVANYNDGTGPSVYGKGKTGGSFEDTFEGVHAVSHDPRAAGVAGYNVSTGPDIYGKSTGGDELLRQCCKLKICSKFFIGSALKILLVFETG